MRCGGCKVSSSGPYQYYLTTYFLLCRPPTWRPLRLTTYFSGKVASFVVLVLCAFNSTLRQSVSVSWSRNLPSFIRLIDHLRSWCRQSRAINGDCVRYAVFFNNLCLELSAECLVPSTRLLWRLIELRIPHFIRIWSIWLDCVELSTIYE